MTIFNCFNGKDLEKQWAGDFSQVPTKKCSLTMMWWYNNSSQVKDKQPFAQLLNSSRLRTTGSSLKLKLWDTHTPTCNNLPLWWLTNPVKDLLGGLGTLWIILGPACSNDPRHGCSTRNSRQDQDNGARFAPWHSSGAITSGSFTFAKESDILQCGIVSFSKI
jgi:hypothetical protein